MVTSTLLSLATSRKPVLLATSILVWHQKVAAIRVSYRLNLVEVDMHDFPTPTEALDLGTATHTHAWGEEVGVTTT
jgi:hypothetical protein